MTTFRVRLQYRDPRTLRVHELKPRVQAANTFLAVKSAALDFLSTRGREELSPLVEQLFQLRAVTSNHPLLSAYDLSDPRTDAQLAGHGSAWFQLAGKPELGRWEGQGTDYHEALIDAWDLAFLQERRDQAGLRFLLGTAEILEYNDRPVSESFLKRKPSYNQLARSRARGVREGWPYLHRWSGSVFVGDAKTEARWSGEVLATAEEPAAKLLRRQAAKGRKLHSSEYDLVRIEFTKTSCPLARGYDRAYRDQHVSTYPLDEADREIQLDRWNSWRGWRDGSGKTAKDRRPSPDSRGAGDMPPPSEPL